MSEDKLKMLINATLPEEIRVALVKGNILFDHDMERPTANQRTGNFYKAVVMNIAPSLDAVFVEYCNGARHGFLPFKEIAPEYYARQPQQGMRPSVKDVMKVGQEILIQVVKDERETKVKDDPRSAHKDDGTSGTKTKGAALTSFVTLAGCYLVLKPNNPKAGGVSRRIEDEERQELKDILNQLPLPEGMGLVLRTAAKGQTIEELRWELDFLLLQWKAIQEAAKTRAAPFLIYEERDAVLRSIRDHLRHVDEIWIDDLKTFENTKAQLLHLNPDFVGKLNYYKEATPLFQRYQIEAQIETAFQKTVELENGGSIVINTLEALVAIDVNSSKATEGHDIEETALRTNLAAAKEIARQLRLRDLGGIIVIDFIDMHSAHNRKRVENYFEEQLTMDRARMDIGRITRFGILVLSRQRLKTALSELTEVLCPQCHGQGSIRSTQSLAISILRHLEQELYKQPASLFEIQMPLEVSTYLINELRGTLLRLEAQYHTKVLIIPNTHFKSPRYEIRRLRTEDSTVASFERPTIQDEGALLRLHSKDIIPEEPAIKSFQDMPLSHSQQEGFIKRLWSKVFGTQEEQTEAKTSIPQDAGLEAPFSKPHNERGPNRGRGRGRGDNRRGGNARRPSQDGQAPREAREPRAPREQREPRPPRDPNEVREPREPRAPREAREPNENRAPREPREARNTQEPMGEARETKEPREPREHGNHHPARRHLRRRSQGQRHGGQTPNAAQDTPVTTHEQHATPTHAPMPAQPLIVEEKPKAPQPRPRPPLPAATSCAIPDTELQSKGLNLVRSKSKTQPRVDVLPQKVALETKQYAVPEQLPATSATLKQVKTQKNTNSSHSSKEEQ